MPDSKRIPALKTYEQMAEFWDIHSLADYWDQTEPAEFEVAAGPRHHSLVAVDSELLARVQRLASSRGIDTRSLVNLLLDQRLHEVEQQTPAVVMEESPPWGTDGKKRT